MDFVETFSMIEIAWCGLMQTSSSVGFFISTKPGDSGSKGIDGWAVLRFSHLQGGGVYDYNKIKKSNCGKLYFWMLPVALDIHTYQHELWVLSFNVWQYHQLMYISHVPHRRPVVSSHACWMQLHSVHILSVSTRGSHLAQWKIYNGLSWAKQNGHLRSFGYNQYAKYTCFERKTRTCFNQQNYTKLNGMIWSTRAPPNWPQYPLPTSHHHQWFVLPGWLGNPPNQDLNVSQSSMERRGIDASKL